MPDQWSKLVEAAAQAQSLYGDDELELFAEEWRKQKEIDELDNDC